MPSIGVSFRKMRLIQSRFKVMNTYIEIYVYINIIFMFKVIPTYLLNVMYNITLNFQHVAQAVSRTLIQRHTSNREFIS